MSYLEIISDGVFFSKNTEGNIPTNNNIPYNGIATKIDDNGKILIGKTWWSNSYKMIGNRGGNLNSVGIETCVNVGSNYINTMRNTAYIVGQLIEKFDLTVNSVKQHNYFSGKDCPQVLRQSGRWAEQLQLIELEYYARTQLKGVQFTWKSLNPEIMDDLGRVSATRPAQAVQVGYEVTVKYNGETKTYTYSSTLNKL